MFDFSSISSQHTTFFDSGLSNSTNNSITSGSPPTAFSSNYIERPGLLFSSLYSTDSSVGAQNGFGVSSSGLQTSTQSSPTHQNHAAVTIESILEPFGPASSQADFASTLAQLTGQKQMDRQNSLNGSIIQRPTSFTTSSLFGNSEFGNPLGAPGTPISSQMGHHHHSPFSTAPHTPLATPNGTAQGNVPPPKNPKLYKTELCRSWMDHGRCNYGERCQYAHGELEKRPVPRHPKYKTEACQSFHQSGYCPYGPRCHFIHNETPSATASQYSTPVTTPVSPPQQPPQQSTPSLYASQYHNMTLKQGSGVPNQVLQRVYSLPNGGYGSAGESPACSSNDSGSESPNGSFSPGLDLEDSGPFSSGFMTAAPHKQQQQSKSAAPRVQTNRFLSYDQSSINDTQFSHMLNDLYQWNLEDSLAFPGFSASKWSTTPACDEVTAVPATTTSTPGRLPVFAQLSNPQ